MAKQLNTVIATWVFAVVPGHDNYIIKCNTGAWAVTINLPSIATLLANFERFYIIDDNFNAAVNNITINAFAGQFIDWVASITLNINGWWAVVQSLDDDKWIAQSSPSVWWSVPTLTQNVAWVFKNGNDGTGVVGRLDLPFLTIQAAVTACVAGQNVYVGAGTYDETINLKNGVNIILADCEVTNSAGWAWDIFRDSWAAVTCSITGSGRTTWVGKTHFRLTNAGSNVTVDINSLTDTLAWFVVSSNGTMQLEAKRMDLTNWLIFGVLLNNGGTMRVECLNCNGSVTSIGGTLRMDWSVVAVAAVSVANVKFFGTAQSLQSTSAWIIDSYGDIFNSGLVWSQAIDVDTFGTVRHFGKIHCDAWANAMRISGSWIVEWRGDIFTNTWDCIEGIDGRCDWDWNLFSNSGRGIQCAAVWWIVSISWTGRYLGSGRWINFENTDPSSECIVTGSRIQVLWVNMWINMSSAWTLRFIDSYVNWSWWLEAINVSSNWLILNNATIIPGGWADSIEAAAAQTVALYGQCHATTAADANVTFAVNVWWYFVNAWVV